MTQIVKWSKKYQRRFELQLKKNLTSPWQTGQNIAIGNCFYTCWSSVRQNWPSLNLAIPVKVLVGYPVTNFVCIQTSLYFIFFDIWGFSWLIRCTLCIKFVSVFLICSGSIPLLITYWLLTIVSPLSTRFSWQLLENSPLINLVITCIKILTSETYVELRTSCQ